jgi:hypothetical protein
MAELLRRKTAGPSDTGREEPGWAGVPGVPERPGPEPSIARSITRSSIQRTYASPVTASRQSHRAHLTRAECGHFVGTAPTAGSRCPPSQAGEGTRCPTSPSDSGLLPTPGHVLEWP